MKDEEIPVVVTAIIIIIDVKHSNEENQNN